MALNATRIGVQVRALKNGRVLYEENAHELFTPASTLKVLTLATALSVLKPSYRFETKVYFDKGTLYLQGSGDPSLLVHQLDDLAGRLKQLLPRRVKNIVIDDSIFDKIYFGDGWDEEDFGKGYSAPISGINVNYNRIVVGFLPGKKMIIDPLTNFIKLKLNKSGEFELRGPGVLVLAPIIQTKTPIYKTYAISDPVQWAGFLFKEALGRVGIVVKTGVKAGKVPAGLEPLTSTWSPYLSEIMINFTKFSNNLGNEAILKTLGAGSFERGIEVVRNFVGSEQNISDGSGLSRRNSISPDFMTRFLVRVANDFHISPEFMAALPTAGEDGTLANAFKNEPFRGELRAKTGGMTGIKCLAGYYQTPNGNRVAVTVFANDMTESTAELHKRVEEILKGI